jgi:Domain of unknown function (DUF2357)/PD-(D/E)XK nuclease superfamily
MPVCQVPHGFIAENKRYEILATLDGHRLPEDVRILLNDVPADGLVRGNSTIFPFEMDFYAGDLRIGAVRGRRVIASADIDVDPDVAKLTRNEYAAMVSDVARATSALYRLGQVTLPASADAAGVRADVVTLDLVRSNFETFERSVSRIADQPVRYLRSTSVTIDTMQARRVTDRTIITALRSGRSRSALAAETRAAPTFVAALGGRWIPTIQEARRTESVDGYENRAVLGFVRWLDGTLASLATRLANGVSEEIHPGTIALWTDRLVRWRIKLHSLARRGVFADLIPEPTLRATSVFRMHPDYASAFAAMSRMKAGLGTGSATSPSVPIDRTFQLYEMWCYINFLLAAAERFPAITPMLGDILNGVRVPNAVGTFLAQGELAEIPLTTELRLTYQRRVTPNGARDGSRTLLVEAIPDITVTRLDGTGRCVAMVVLDPKYRTGASLMNGVRDLHVYRDAILDAKGNRLIRGAVALAPRALGFPQITSDLPSDVPGIVVTRPGCAEPGVFDRLLIASLNALGACDVAPGHGLIN